jgi:tetratricopeptide (TPR) repeat protein
MDTSNQAMQGRLAELGTLETVSVFSRAFYRLIVGLVVGLEAEGSVRVALAGLLEVELRYHRELQHLSERQEVGMADLQSAAERHRIGLHAVCEYARKLQHLDLLAAAIRGLVLAEANYHLHRTAEVVAALEQVVALGLSQPLVYFALGYNRYLLALETYTEPTEAEGERVLRDPAAFRVQCLKAVSDLEEGLGDTDLDGQLYWWMGVILEAAGLTDAAQDAYDKSADLLPAHEARWDAERDQPSPDPREISDEEVAQAGELLGTPLDLAALAGGEPEDR